MKARHLMLALFTTTTFFPSSARSVRGRVADPAGKLVASTCDTDLALAKRFVELGDWKDAESHFVVAAKEPKCQQEGLAGIEIVRRNADASLLRTGEIYELEHQWSKAEALYSAAASDPSIGGATRKIARERLRSVMQTQAREMKWSRDSVAEWVKDVAALIVFLLSLVLLVSTFRSIGRRRRAIIIHPFEAPTDQLANELNIHMKYARATMNNPAFSGAAQIPPFLIENLHFSDEVEPIEDLEIAGSKIPFSSLERLFGRPTVQVTGGLDGVWPLGNAYSMVETHDSSADAFIGRQIRGVAHERRLDLLDFAYDVLVKASSAYADI